MGGLICCCWRMFCCECTICDKRDVWKIDDEIRPGEIGAGYMYKKAKGSAMWSKRYFVLTPYKFKYYLERDRQHEKGEIILAGATASNSSTRANSKKKFYFNVSHPQCGVRELYVKSENRRMQWIEKINQLSETLMRTCIFGKLLKQGGLGKNIWQERWCISTRDTIDYFDSPTDNQGKGTIVITNAVINPMKIKDRFCFEVTASGPPGKSKKANKKYVFATEKEFDRDKWVEILKRNSVPQRPPQYDENGHEIPPPPISPHGSPNPNGGGGSPPPSGNPMHRGSADDYENGDGEGIQANRSASSNSFSTSTANTEMAGYLMKKSPAVMKGWQKRYFRTEKNGDITYFKSEEDANTPNAEVKGVIRIKDVVSQPMGIQFNEKTFEINITLQTKKVQLRAMNLDEGTDWAQNIINCVEALKIGK